MKCDCISKLNKTLEAKGVQLKQHLVMDMKTFTTSSDIALETVSIKKGVKPFNLFLAFCPFCGKKN